MHKGTARTCAPGIVNDVAKEREEEREEKRKEKERSEKRATRASPYITPLLRCDVPGAPVMREISKGDGCNDTRCSRMCTIELTNTSICMHIRC